MSLPLKLLTSLLIAAAATALVTRLRIEGALELGLVFAFATTLTVLLGQVSLRFSMLSEPDERRERGKVKWFNSSKGFGFIIRASGEEIFVHSRAVRQSGQHRRSLRDGQSVTFVVRRGGKGPQAEEVEAG